MRYLFDVYRVLLLAEMVLLEAAYLWSALKYWQQLARIKDPDLRQVRLGVTLRTTGIMLMVALFIYVIIGRLGHENTVRLLTNVILQIVLACWLLAWVLVDRRRFIGVEKDVERSEAALSALDRIAASEWRRERKAKERAQDRRDASGGG